ncbi:uncharacterized protein AMSG_08412 [Thecamonas trahens ATCC 50062]|uniref:Uncharacterized protein n=1 Tax=Thecamonas trahens ATCC 50062 TaxID=461836 RepID=A0A0L0DM12_THETB|nr:hypothetical protein AMSG_08412 [Thecamonas trahens ATCC 50062]KNC52433.1 hypothetical protein AMSG_08412 [Thecamonas trahens ATCC 50062]|eukprot:XP_013755474.1 hypothetical protein AMSG_08412 [Thecamonas trahens ATCC 50062]
MSARVGGATEECAREVALPCRVSYTRAEDGREDVTHVFELVVPGNYAVRPMMLSVNGGIFTANPAQIGPSGEPIGESEALLLVEAWTTRPEELATALADAIDARLAAGPTPAMGANELPGCVVM